MEEIEMYRGDTLIIVFAIEDIAGEKINKDDIETLFLTARKYPDLDSKVLFEKEMKDFNMVDGLFEVTIEPECTEKLRLDTIYYDFEVTLKDGFRKTEVGTIKLKKDVTIHM